MGLKSSLDEILKNIERAKRNTFTKKDVILVAATKTRSFNQINQVYSLGIRHIGENRIQEAEGKFESFEEMPKITRRFIGHLQSNKININAAEIRNGYLQCNQNDRVILYRIPRGGIPEFNISEGVSLIHI